MPEVYIVYLLFVHVLLDVQVDGTVLDSPISSVHVTPIIKSALAKTLSTDCISSPLLIYDPSSSYDSMSPRQFFLLWVFILGR